MTDPELLSLLREWKRDILSSICCALPGVVQSFDPATQTASVLPALRKKNAAGDPVAMPLLQDVPVFFPGGASSAVTFPVRPGDECLLIFADACIDGWFDTGEAVLQPSSRSHDLSDAFAFVGFRSRRKALSSFPDGPSFFSQGGGS